METVVSKRSAYRFFWIREQESDGHDDKTWINSAVYGKPSRGTLQHLPPLKPGHHRDAAGKSQPA
jgi:hypothetical protein